MHRESAFITLTYDDKNLPEGGTLVVAHAQEFIKKLRERVDYAVNKDRPLCFKSERRRIRFFLAGEYGERRERPHYHAIIFGWKFPDQVKLPQRGEFAEWDSPMLRETWGKGKVHGGSVTFDSAMYVANYATKKITGEKADAHYRGRRPEFLLMSRKPGIGKPWFDKFAQDVYPADECIVRGMPSRPPRYYDLLWAVQEPAQMEEVKQERERKSEKLESVLLRTGHTVEIAPSRNAQRLKVREDVARAKLALKSRRL